MNKKRIKHGAIALLCTLLILGCNDAFLEKRPTTDFNQLDYWKTLEDLRVYNNGIYNEAGRSDVYTFMAAFANGGWNSSLLGAYAMEAKSDNAASFVSSHASYVQIAAGQENVPSTSKVGEWHWSLLRRINVMLENYDKVESEAVLKNHYVGEALFFRAWFYLDKVQQYGDVPLVTKPLTETSKELYKTQDSRQAVMEQVLKDINQAIEYLPAAWPKNAPDRVTKWTANALKSRICLFEGTYRKYHGMEGAENFLKEAAAASKQVIDSKKYKLYNTGKPESDYRQLFISEDLHNNPEVITARYYAKPAMGHRTSGYISTQSIGATHDFVEDFLCVEEDQTALPVALSKAYNDSDPTAVFNNRDPRLKQIVLDPREELEILKTSYGYPRIKGMSTRESATGYHFIKYYNNEDDTRGFGNEISDYPLFRYGEILLNYAEAKAELGEMTQADLDLTINDLRDRAGMPHLTLNPVMDPKYAHEGISPLLVEIRRERRVELAYELFRYQDLMRWKKGGNLAKPVLGIRIEDKDLAEGGLFDKAKYPKLKIQRVEVDGKKFLDVYAGTSYASDRRVFDESKHYLHPIPLNVIAKNPQLRQNNGWK